MNNQELAKIFYEIAEFLRMDEIPFKPYAYQRAAMTLESLEEDINDVYERGGLKDLEDMKGVGKSIALKIEEYLKTGRIRYYDNLKKRLPLNLGELLQVEGMGPKKARTLYKELGVRDLKTLEGAAKSHKIAALAGFGEKTEQNILEGLEFLKRSKGRYLLGEILPEVKSIIKRLESLKEVEQISPAGSVRRRKDTIGDVDILVTTKNPKKVMDFFLSFSEIMKVWGKGSTKSSIRLRQGFDVDLRVLRKKSYGSALQYFTGSKEHNIAVRRIAMQKGLKLSEYGLFKGSKMIAGGTEQSIYKALGMDYIEPELREDRGEIQAAILHNLPKLIGYNDLKGDLHCHSNWDGGEDSIAEMARVAKDMGYEYIGISDHTKFLRIEKGLDEKKLAERNKEIDRLNKNEKGFKILKGAEVNILNDGTLDIKDEALKRMDYVIAGVHSNFKMERKEMTERIINAIKNPNIDILSHPTGRILKRRDEYNCDFDEILKTAKKYNVALEINASMERMDLNDQNIKKAKEAGVKMVINSDAHQKEGLKPIELGISQARRGWADKEDIINTNSLERLLTYFH
ncbi:MAG: DNA polymerase/3'-5' exonuclease PolX [Candidatus Paceibacterota bacterium]|jgi:DNA polymerase (family 10)